MVLWLLLLIMCFCFSIPMNGEGSGTGEQLVNCGAGLDEGLGCPGQFAEAQLIGPVLTATDPDQRLGWGLADREAEGQPADLEGLRLKMEGLLALPVLTADGAGKGLTCPGLDIWEQAIPSS